MNLSAGLTTVSFLVMAASTRAEVADASVNGFTIKATLSIQASPDDVYRRIVRNVGDWWDPSHTFSGNSRNLTIKKSPPDVSARSYPTAVACGTCR